ncbi:hypothetical protein B835_981 [Enterococcus mundtii 3F]|nr:hypothetical protein [Enterococcus mundtii 3F]
MKARNLFLSNGFFAFILRLVHKNIFYGKKQVVTKRFL